MRAAGRWTRAPPEDFPAASLRPDPAAADEARAHREAGNALFVREAWRDAVARYDASVRLDASVASTFTNRAAARYALFSQTDQTRATDPRGELALALRDAEQSLALDARWVKGHYRKGACLMRLGDFVAAREAFRDGLAHDPNNQQIKAAARDAETAIAETPIDWEDAKSRGNACYRDGKYEDAARWYTRGLEFLPTRFSEGEAEEDDGAGADADADADADAANANANAAAAATLLANRAEARRQMSECRACVSDCDRALKHDPKHVKALVRRALAREYLEQYADAARDFEAAARLDPTNRIAREGSRRVSAFVA